MAHIAASVLARLKNKAKESGRSYQLCLQLFCQEEFLRRLEKSQYAENLVLKGGLFIYYVTDFDSRVTVDVDFLLRKVPNTPEQLQTVIETIISTPTGNDFVTFEIKDIAPIAVAKRYAGIGVSLVAQIKNTKTPFSIDFGVGDVIVPKQEKRKFDFDGATLTEVLRKTFENRGHTFTPEQFEQVMAFDSDEAMQKKWKSFVRKIDIKTNDYSIVLKTIKAFLTKPFTAADVGKEFNDKWSATNGEWI